MQLFWKTNTFVQVIISGNVYVADLTSLQVVDFIRESYFGSDDISVFALRKHFICIRGKCYKPLCIGYQLNFASVVMLTQ